MAATPPVYSADAASTGRREPCRIVAMSPAPSAILALILAVDAGAPPSRTAPAPAADACKRPPKDRSLVKVNLKPDSEVADVISWYAAMTCTPVLVSSATPLAGKKVTILSPKPITVAELRRLFHAALDSVGLAAEPDGKFLRIIDAARARPGATRVR
jgi:type II secretory pathway component GspD/PulD (secretin)